MDEDEQIEILESVKSFAERNRDLLAENKELKRQLGEIREDSNNFFVYLEKLLDKLNDTFVNGAGN